MIEGLRITRAHFGEASVASWIEENDETAVCPIQDICFETESELEGEEIPFACKFLFTARKRGGVWRAWKISHDEYDVYCPYCGENASYARACHALEVGKNEIFAELLKIPEIRVKAALRLKPLATQSDTMG